MAYKLFAIYYEQVAIVVNADAPRIPDLEEVSETEVGMFLIIVSGMLYSPLAKMNVTS